MNDTPSHWYTEPTLGEYSLAPSRGCVLQLRGNPVRGANPRRPVLWPCDRAPPRARALLPATRCQSSGPLGALLSSPALDVRLMTALQVLQVLQGNSIAQHWVLPSLPWVVCFLSFLHWARDWRALALTHRYTNGNAKEFSRKLPRTKLGTGLARTGTNTGTPKECSDTTTASASHPSP